jgi:hypothetical protein
MFNKIEWKRHLLITGCYENVKNTQFVTKYNDIYIGVHFSIESGLTIFNRGIDTMKITALSNHKQGIINNYIRRLFYFYKRTFKMK